MPIQKQKRDSDIEKRMKLLQSQLYGGNNKYKVSKEKIETNSVSIAKTSSRSSSTELGYLRKDLVKIVLFSILAFGAQFALLFASRNHFLRLF